MLSKFSCLCFFNRTHVMIFWPQTEQSCVREKWIPQNRERSESKTHRRRKKPFYCVLHRTHFKLCSNQVSAYVPAYNFWGVSFPHLLSCVNLETLNVIKFLEITNLTVLQKKFNSFSAASGSARSFLKKKCQCLGVQVWKLLPIRDKSQWFSKHGSLILAL